MFNFGQVRNTQLFEKLQLEGQQCSIKTFALNTSMRLIANKMIQIIISIGLRLCFELVNKFYFVFPCDNLVISEIFSILTVWCHEKIILSSIAFFKDF